MDFPARSFPTVAWGESLLMFLPSGTPLPVPAPIAAALTFVIYDGRFVVADIAGRGWCIPGGRLEAGETPEAAARREAWEEAGAILGPMTRIGHFQITDIATASIAFVPTFLAAAERWEPQAAGLESRGARLLAFEELPAHYYRWDALLEAAFRYALAQMPGR